MVVPCFNEAKRLPVDAFRDSLEKDPHTIFLFVNDGSTDNTQAVLEKLHECAPQRFHVHTLKRNGGKAEAVRAGMLQALQLTLPGKQQAGVLGLWDADLAAPLDCIALLNNVLIDQPQVEMVFGSRKPMPDNRIERSLIRHSFGRVFAMFASKTLQLPIYDTQCGAKLFRVNETLRQALVEPFISRWTFGIEFTARWLSARRGTDTPQADVAIHEYPLPAWRDVPGSKVRPMDLFIALRDLRRIRKRYMR